MNTETLSIIEGNKLIAEFMGVKYYNNEFITGQLVQYHSSWDWLMPSLKKFGDMTVTDESRKHWQLIVEIGLASIDISATWQYFVKAIQWYNNQTFKP
jgi:hypothetical protein